MAEDERASFVVVVFSEAGQWQAELLPQRLTGDLAGLLAVLRQQPSEGGAIGLVDIGDDFFVAARVQAGGERLLLSDVTAAADWDLARQVCERLGVDVPEGDELDEVMPVGDLALFHDLGVDERELGTLLSDVDAYADEQLLALAHRLGFAGAYERVVGSGRQ
ncbi:MAG: tRNA adenosine deaminase-associated protein [Mycobacteriales bacterium]